MLSVQGAQVQSLVRELRSPIPCGVAKRLKKKKERTGKKEKGERWREREEERNEGKERETRREGKKNCILLTDFYLKNSTIGQVILQYNQLE